MCEGCLEVKARPCFDMSGGPYITTSSWEAEALHHHVKVVIDLIIGERHGGNDVSKSLSLEIRLEANVPSAAAALWWVVEVGVQGQ